MAAALPMRARTALRALSRGTPLRRSEPLLAEQPPREVQHENALPGIGLVPHAGDEDLGNASLMDRSGASSLSVSKLEMFLSFETEGRCT